MRRTALATGLVLAACGSEEGPSCPEPPAVRCAAATSSPTLAVVSTLVVETPVADTLVVTHRPDGSIIARGRTDTEGCAQVPSEPGALLTVAGVVGGRSEIVTTTAPAADRRVVRLRTYPDVDCVAGRMRIHVQNAATLGPRDRSVTFTASAGCDRYECISAGSETQPFELPIPAHLVGSDGTVHVHVRECVESVDELQNFVVTCRDAVLRAAAHGEVAVSVGDPFFDFQENAKAEVDGQLFPAIVLQSSHATLPGLPADHMIRNTNAGAGEEHRHVRIRWPFGERYQEPFPEDFLPTFEGGAMLTETRALQLPAPPYEADAIFTWIPASGATTWFAILPPGLTPITLPDDPDLPATVQPFAMPAMIYDDIDRADFEALVGAGIFFNNVSESPSLDLRADRMLRSTLSRNPP